MNCPICESVSLMMTERNGIEIDYCPKCRGVWLDRGELDKIIEKSASSNAQSTGQVRTADYDKGYSNRPEHYDQNRSYGNEGYYKKKRREGFLGELFDFD